MNVEELRIQVPWGHLAARAWGNTEHPAVLVFHGVMDNAGSFNRLIPLLPKTFRYVCFDLPGHGFSSHFPPHLPIHSINYIMVYKLVVLHFGERKYKILGHSYGGQLGLLFAQLYPEYVESLVMLDTIHLFPVPTRFFKSSLRERFDFCIEMYEKMNKRQAPQYTYQEALDKVMTQRYTGNITQPAAEALLSRALQRCEGAEDKYVFTTDQRLKTFINPIQDFKYINSTLEKFPFQCPILLILAGKNNFQERILNPILKTMKRNSLLMVKKVDGEHDVHNDSPETVAPYVSRFLTRGLGKL